MDTNNPFANPADFACGSEADESSLCTATTPCAQHYLDKLASWGEWKRAPVHLF